MIRLISFVKTQIQINLFDFSYESKNPNVFSCQNRISNEFSRQNIISNEFDTDQIAFFVKTRIQINLLNFSCQNTDSNRFIWLFFLDFSCQKGTLIWKNILSNLWMLTRLIYLVKTQIQILLFEFSRQNIISKLKQIYQLVHG